MGTMQRKSVARLAAGADTAIVLATIVEMEIRAHAPWYRVQLRVLAELLRQKKYNPRASVTFPCAPFAQLGTATNGAVVRQARRHLPEV